MSIDSNEYPDDFNFQTSINPHCRYCGWAYSPREAICPMCGQTRTEYDHDEDEDY